MSVRVSYRIQRLAAGSLLVSFLAAHAAAQESAPSARPHATEAATAALSSDSRVPAERVALTAGRSTVLSTAFDITRIAVTNPAVADAVVVQPREILIDGKAAGTVSLIVWGAQERRQYDVVVHDLEVLHAEQTVSPAAACESPEVR